MAFTSFVLISTSLIGFSGPASLQEMPSGKDHMAVLVAAMGCEDFWVSVHATEYLIDLGHTELAEKNCVEHLSTYEEVPQKRIGLWRVQYQLATDASKKSQLLNKLISAYLAPEGPDRLHAAETLAKLRYCFKALNQQTVLRDTEQGGMMGAFVTWGMAVACGPQANDDQALLMHLLGASATERRLAAYGLSFLAKPTHQQWLKLARVALTEADTETKAYLLGAAYQLYDTDNTADAAIYEQLRTQFLALANSDTKSVRMELCRALASRKDRAGHVILTRLAGKQSPITSLPDGEADLAAANGHPWNIDIRATAAYALLKYYINE